MIVLFSFQNHETMLAQPMLSDFETLFLKTTRRVPVEREIINVYDVFEI